MKFYTNLLRDAILNSEPRQFLRYYLIMYFSLFSRILRFCEVSFHSVAVFG